MKESKKHHYIPRFYLKGFTDDNNQFYVFDKQENKIWQSTPDNSFFEKYRNTGTVENFDTKKIHKTDLPETVLAHFDGRSANALNEIKKSTPQDKMLTPERIHALRFFIISTFWRIPANDKLREHIIKKFSFKDLGFGIFDEQGQRCTETENILKEIDLWNKMYPTFLPISSVIGKHNTTNISDWKLYYRGNSFHLITDNTILLKDYVDFSSLQEELIIPLSSKHLLVITKKAASKVIAPVFSLKIDILLFRKAHRYVASSDKSYLEFIIKESREHPEFSDDKILEDIFNHFD